MKSMPSSVAAYKRTPTFTNESIPAGLRRAHQTKADTWGKIVVLTGNLRYRILEPEHEEVILTPTAPGVVEPQVLHEVAPLESKDNDGSEDEVSFYVEFYK